MTDSQPPRRPGPVYDNALRLLAAEDLQAVCRWLGVDADPGSTRLSEALPAAAQYVDLLVGTGGRLAQVEFVRNVEADLGLRMVEYRARLMRLRPGAALRQHVVVLAAGTVPAEVRDGEEFRLRLHVTYLRDHDPDELLASPSLAPLAALGRAGGPADRRRVLVRALALIAAADPTRRQALAATATTLSTIHLDRASIDHAWKEAGMPISISDTEFAESFREEGRAEGRQQGRQEGRAEARAEMVAALLRRRFGDDARVPAVAARLAELPAEETLAAVESAQSLDELD